MNQEHTGADFSVRVQPRSREAVCVIYMGQGMQLTLDAERIGAQWEGIKVVIPENLEAEIVAGLVTRLEAAFQALGLGYMIIRLAEKEPVSESDQKAAILGLREIGIELKVSTDRKQMVLQKNATPQHTDQEARKKNAQQMLSLIRDAQGTRPRFQILAKSKEF